MYKDDIQRLVQSHPLSIDTNIIIEGKVPTSVSSEFITNKEQGDWAENIVFNTINNENSEYIAIHYGRNDNLSAGDDGFKEFYKTYQNELNTIGKRPDILIFKKTDYQKEHELNDKMISKAVCAIEVRSSSFLVEKYNSYMSQRHNDALERIRMNITNIMNSNLKDILEKKIQLSLNILPNPQMTHLLH